MGLLNFVKGKKVTEDSKFPEKISACVKGKMIPITEVQDETFASEVLGKGYGIIPESDDITAPVDGVIEMVFPTKHAIGMKTKSGVEILIHIGIDTVELKGKGFDCFVKPGDRVKQGQLMERTDIKKIRDLGYDTTVMLLITNTNEYENIKLQNDILCVEKTL